MADFNSTSLFGCLIFEIASDDPGLVSEVSVDDAGLVSDHRLIHCKLRLNRPISRPVAITFRRRSKIGCTAFEGSLLRSSLFLNPASSADAFTNQLASVITEELHRVAPLRTTSRRQSKPITWWLSKEAVAIKREKRRLKNSWKARYLEANYVTYRQCCRSTTKVINASRREHYRQQLNNTSSAAKTWKIFKELLHSADRDEKRTDEENQRLCNTSRNSLQLKSPPSIPQFLPNYPPLILHILPQTRHAPAPHSHPFHHVQLPKYEYYLLPPSQNHPDKTTFQPPS